MSIRTIISSSLVCLAALVMAGCGNGESSFVPGKSTGKLMTGAQAQVRKTVDTVFGTPQNLVVWDVLPINDGGIRGTLTDYGKSSAGAATTKWLTITLDSDWATDSPEGATIDFYSGVWSQATIKEWNPETGQVLLTDKVARADGSKKKDVPQKPSVGEKIVINSGVVLRHGRSLYQRHCSHCHGTSGDGAGPTAEYLHPLPRDYRLGKFKFISNKTNSRPSRDDLHRILKNGVPGTYMPSFVPMLKDEELTAVIEYVRFLSMRGEFEEKLGIAFTEYTMEAYSKSDEKKQLVADLKSFIQEDLKDELEYVQEDLKTAWTDADDFETSGVFPVAPRVPDSLASRQRGRELFVGKALNCVNCHGIDARGNGPQTEDFEEGADEPGLHNAWGHVVKPRNLTTGIYRGGRRPIDLYRRIVAGIDPSKMPAFGGKMPIPAGRLAADASPEDRAIAQDEQVWHLVNYVLSVPFEVEPGHLPEPVLAETDEPQTTPEEN